MDALEAIFTRRSTRRMKPELPSKELIEKVVEAVRAYMEGPGSEKEETITGGLIPGYGCDGLPVRNALARTGNPVTWVCDEEGD